jgi:hypothetical protein
MAHKTTEFKKEEVEGYVEALHGIGLDLRRCSG